MAFTGLSTNDLFTSSTLGEDISRIIGLLTPVESEFLDWLGDPDVFATSTKHEFVEGFLRPTYIITSTGINSATAATGATINGHGAALTVGTLLENETSAEIMQVTSAVGPNSVLFSRNYDGSGIGSLAVGGRLRVRWPAGVEGADHDGTNAQRNGNRRANTVGLFNVPIAASGTALAIANNILGGDSYESNRAKIFREVPYRLEEAALTGVLNAANSLASETTTRTMLGLRPQITTVNSQVVVASFAANPALYIGNVWEQVFDQGGSVNEQWALVCGRTTYKDISNLNDTSVMVDNVSSSEFRRVIRQYTGAFGGAQVLLSRALANTDVLLVPRERVKVVPLQGRSFSYLEMGMQGDSRKGMVVGEYTIEAHHTAAMGRIRANG